MSILKRQVNSCSDFSSFFSVIAYNSSVHFQPMHFLLWTKLSREITKFDTFQSFKFFKFLMSFTNFRIFNAQIKIHQILVICDAKNWFYFKFCTSLFSIMRHNSSLLFLAKMLYIFNKKILSKQKFGEISSEQLKVSKFALWWASFVKII